MKKLPRGVKIEFGFGIELDSTGAPITAVVSNIAGNHIIRLANHLFGGCTVCDTRGIWTDPAGKVFDERGKTLTVLVESIQPDIERRVEELILSIKHELDQQAVAVTITDVRTGII